MIIEHDGKRIDTEKEIRRVGSNLPARYVGCFSDRQLIFEWGQGCWDVYTSDRAVMKFENVPQKHEKWYVVSKETGYVTEEAAKVVASSYGNLVVARAEWES